MARILLSTVLIAAVGVLVGCQGPNSGSARILPTVDGTPFTSAPRLEMDKVTETDMVEEVAINRAAYHQSLNRLIQYYKMSGDHAKFTLAKKELAGFATMPKYDYIIEATVGDAGLRAADSIPEANYLYREAMDIERTAGPLSVFRDKNLLRLALGKYNLIIRKYPSSDKIDDAAYRAGLICEYFKDYDLALLYYKRSYQWDKITPYPSMYREALLLDKKLHRRADALATYRRALELAEARDQKDPWMQRARERVQVLTKSK